MSRCFPPNLRVCSLSEPSKHTVFTLLSFPEARDRLSPSLLGFLTARDHPCTRRHALMLLYLFLATNSHPTCSGVCGMLTVLTASMATPVAPHRTSTQYLFLHMHAYASFPESASPSRGRFPLSRVPRVAGGNSVSQEAICVKIIH